MASYGQQHIICALDTLVTPLTLDEFGWGPISVSLLFCGFAASGMTAILLAMKLSRSGVANRYILYIGCSVVTCACCLLGATYTRQAGVVAGGCLIAFGCLMVTSPNGAVYTELIGECNQGTFNGVRQVAMSIGRIVGPLTYGFIWGLPRLGHDVFIVTLLAVAAGPLLSLAIVFPKFRVIDDAGRVSKGAPKYEPLLDEIAKDCAVNVIEEQEGGRTWRDEEGARSRTSVPTRA